MKTGSCGPNSTSRTAEWMPSAPTSRSTSIVVPFVEGRLDAVAVVDEPGEPVADVQALGRQRADERAEQVGAVHLVVREAEGLDDGIAQVGAQQGAPVVPAALVPGQRADAHAAPGRRRVRGRCRTRDALGLTWMPAPTSLTAPARS